MRCSERTRDLQNGIIFLCRFVENVQICVCDGVSFLFLFFV